MLSARLQSYLFVRRWIFRTITLTYASMLSVTVFLCYTHITFTTHFSSVSLCPLHSQRSSHAYFSFNTPHHVQTTIPFTNKLTSRFTTHSSRDHRMVHKSRCSLHLNINTGAEQEIGSFWDETCMSSSDFEFQLFHELVVYFLLNQNPNITGANLLTIPHPLSSFYFSQVLHIV